MRKEKAVGLDQILLSLLATDPLTSASILRAVSSVF
jgi:hypothetical protein